MIPTYLLARRCKKDLTYRMLWVFGFLPKCNFLDADIFKFVFSLVRRQSPNVWQLLILPGGLSPCSREKVLLCKEKRGLYRVLSLNTGSQVSILDEQNRGWEENIFKQCTKAPSDLVTDQHLLSPFSSSFLGVKCLYDMGSQWAAISLNLLRSRIHSSLTGGIKSTPAQGCRSGPQTTLKKKIQNPCYQNRYCTKVISTGAILVSFCLQQHALLSQSMR